MKTVITTLQRNPQQEKKKKKKKKKKKNQKIKFLSFTIIKIVISSEGENVHFLLDCKKNIHMLVYVLLGPWNLLHAYVYGEFA